MYSMVVHVSVYACLCVVVDFCRLLPKRSHLIRHIHSGAELSAWLMVQAYTEAVVDAFVCHASSLSGSESIVS